MAINQLGLVQPIGRLCERVVTTATADADRRFDARFRQTLALANRDVLRPAVAVVDQIAVMLRLPRVQSLL